ncbi:MAG: VPLPA-CTERM sorting domain-containing protein [Gammaproteobacteria bacterium]|nr:VPLPA-CTERM sorting domain-containing protein [Gammaproteobacteria bacterium]
MKIKNILSAILVTSSITGSVSAGTIAEYWITAGDQELIYVVQGNQVINTITTPVSTNEYPIAVGDTIRTADVAGSTTITEYNPDGTLSGNSYTTSLLGTHFDGATDGINYNYATDWRTGTVYRYDMYWANGETLFTPSYTTHNQLWNGITYDSSSDSIWLNSRGSNPEFRNYSLNGDLLSSFALDVYANWGLAYEAQTDTLWSLGSYGTSGWSILNISKDGTVLESTVINGLTGNLLGGEMRISSVPVPAAVWLFGSGLIGLFGFARRKKI